VGTSSKIACSVAKKVAKLAVDRNRLKRQCREALRENIESPTLSIIGIVRIMSAETTSADFQTEIKEIFTALK
jgi:ribonuclease P protein component